MEYFTFVPDFTPESFCPSCLHWLEEWLEATSLRRCGVRFIIVATLRRV